MTGEKLKEWRESRGLTQEQLAAMLGMKWETYRQQEMGRFKVHVLMALALCEVERRHKLKRSGVAVEQITATDQLPLADSSDTKGGGG